ncbi:MAG: hypothetical protein EA396_10430 [Anaerolineaceae bacterium]|nr:MAG: hypothetical protein EA396_10430 [Anaerolineaceae bacterium]
MRRNAIHLIFALILLGILPVAIAQDPPPDPTPDPFDVEAVPPEDVFEEFTPDFEIPPAEGEGEDDFAPEVLPEEPPAPEEPPPLPIIPNTLQILIEARIDLETLAATTLGASRPAGWSGSTDSIAPDFAVTIRVDLEILARSLVGETPPTGWFGVVPSSPYAIARDIRHDLELLVDALEIERPPNWAGTSPLLRCDRATQALILLLDDTTDFTLQADRTAPDFCSQATREAATFAERRVDSEMQSMVAASAQAAAEPRITQENAVGFINLSATARAGIMPVGERLELVARQPGDAATLVLVRGVGFELFVDYRNTNITPEQFLALRSVGGMRVDPRCSAAWCD